MNGALRFICCYALAYVLAVWAGTDAFQHGDTLSAAGLFVASAGLLLGIQRECRHTARLIRLGAVHRHPQVPGPHEPAAAVERVVFPPGCLCETWWTSLGNRHDPRCPARTWEEGP